MPFILAGLAILAAAVYYALRLYWTVSAHFGALAGTASVAACVAVVVGLAIHALRRYRAVHGVKANGERILVLQAEWGQLSLDAEQKRGTLTLEGQSSPFIFADIEPPTVATENGEWMLILKLRHNLRAEWPLRLASRSDAQRWARILTLAIRQKL